MRYLTLGELISLHRRIIKQSGGGDGVRDMGLAESALAQPKMTFGGEELYPTIPVKAAALCFSLVIKQNGQLKKSSTSSPPARPRRRPWAKSPRGFLDGTIQNASWNISYWPVFDASRLCQRRE
jgi:hypothetical protein